MLFLSQTKPKNKQSKEDMSLVSNCRTEVIKGCGVRQRVCCKGKEGGNDFDGKILMLWQWVRYVNTFVRDEKLDL